MLWQCAMPWAGSIAAWRSLPVVLHKSIPKPKGLPACQVPKQLLVVEQTLMNLMTGTSKAGRPLCSGLQLPLIRKESRTASSSSNGDKLTTRHRQKDASVQL